jgi:hypothetical protein
MKFKNFLKIYLVVCNLLYSAVIVDLDSELKELSNEVILNLDPEYPNFEQIKRVLTEANKIQTLDIANLPREQREKIAETQIHLVSFLMALKDKLITISKDLITISNNKTDNLLQLFLQDIYNNNQFIKELYQRGPSFINDDLEKITDSSLEIFAKKLGINLVKTEKKSLEVQTQEKENALLKEKFKAILLLIDQLNDDDKTIKNDLLNIKFKSPQDFEERLPELLADRLVELISIPNIGNNRDWLTQKIAKDLTPDTKMGDFKEFIGIITPEQRIGRRLQQFLLNLATKDNLEKYKGLIKEDLEVKARNILLDTNINENKYLNFINPDKNKSLRNQFNVLQEATETRHAAERAQLKKRQELEMQDAEANEALRIQHEAEILALKEKHQQEVSKIEHR